MSDLSEMKLGDAGASVAISLAAYGVMGGMNVFDALGAAEGVLKGLQEQHDPTRGRRTFRMLGTVPVIEAMVAMGEIIDRTPGAGKLTQAFDRDATFEDPDPTPDPPKPPKPDKPKGK
jgi:hypothetical protein